MHFRFMLSIFWLLAWLSGSLGSLSGNQKNVKYLTSVYESSDSAITTPLDGLYPPPPSKKLKIENQNESTSDQISRFQTIKAKFNPNVKIPKTSRSSTFQVRPSTLKKDSNASRERGFGTYKNPSNRAHENHHSLSTAKASPYRFPSKQVDHHKSESCDRNRGAQNAQINQMRIPTQETTFGEPVQEIAAEQPDTPGRDSFIPPSRRTHIEIEGDKTPNLVVSGTLSSAKPKVLHACFELYGNHLIPKLELRQDRPKWEDSVFVKDYGDNIHAHSTKSIVVYIELINLVFSGGLTPIPADLKKIQENAVSQVETFWDQYHARRVPNIFFEEHEMKQLNSFYHGSNRDCKASNAICGSIFVCWLRKNFKDIYTDFHCTKNPTRANPQFLALLHVRLFGLVGNDGLTKARDKNRDLDSFLEDAKIVVNEDRRKSASSPKLVQRVGIKPDDCVRRNSSGRRQISSRARLAKKIQGRVKGSHSSKRKLYSFASV